MTSRVQHRRTSTPNNPPVGLAPGELSIEMAEPRNLWVGVPVALDPSGRKLLATGDPANWITKAYVDNANSAQDATIATKADKSYVDAQDALKADKTYVDAQDAGKVNDTGDTMTGALILPVGTAALPSLGLGATNVGLAGVGSAITFSTAGTLRVTINNGAVQSTVPYRAANGSAAAPSFTFSSDTASGIYRPAAGNLVTMAMNGADVMNWASTTKVTTAFGPVMLAANPTASLEAATKQYVDARAFPEAPQDGLTYGRKNAAWAVSIGGATPSDTPPPGPLVNGQLWFRSTIASLYCYYDDTVGAPQWVQVSASPQMVDNNYSRKTARRANLCINGALNVSQENGSTETTSVTNYYAADQFVTQVTAAGLAWGFGRIAAVNLSGSQFRLQFRVTTAKAVLAAGDAVAISTKIEGLNTQDLGWTTTAPKDAVMTFGFRGPAGIYCVAIRNAGPYTHTFVQSFTISAGQANIDTLQTIKVPAPANSNWAVDNTPSVEVWISLGIGSTNLTPTTGWQAGIFVGVTGMSNGLAAVQSFQIWDIGLYADPDKTGLAPLFEVPDYATELAKCSRYFQKIPGMLLYGYGNVSNIVIQSWLWPVQTRIAPTVAYSAVSYGNASALVTNLANTQLLRAGITITALGNASCNFDLTLNARM